VEYRVFSETGEWTCPQCGEKSTGPKCGRCKFCIYAGFLPRVFSSVVDKGVIWSAAHLFLLVRNFSLTGFWGVTIFGFLFYRFYHIGCVALWGQTPGKMAAKIKVVRVNGSAATLGNAFLRNSVETLLTLVVLVLEMKAVTMVSTVEFAATDFAKRAALMDSFVPEIAVYIAWATQAFVLSEFVILFLNKKKRAIHDFIAGTVVIHDPRLPFFPRRRKAPELSKAALNR
jgi:uncharacterized RDD family membrane protein YckC